ncbi:unnamed protein product (plasmid) [Mycetohabitans rhizoxinica HKI 454]|uniref:Transposase n=1 Tax=Mycetohabitans rhizoxinica (strain DSM 19002 / CIP 109453 / HKI 454) TaxID=882378 RepID=E5AW41_MYCRK|nr:unnamed protein product [Mycetohabitans rhizoxinica HKI 454]
MKKRLARWLWPRYQSLVLLARRNLVSGKDGANLAVLQALNAKRPARIHVRQDKRNC